MLGAALQREKSKGRMFLPYKHLINTIKVFPFTVILGGDSRCNRYEVEEHPAEDDEEEIRDMDRKHSDFKRSEAMNHT